MATIDQHNQIMKVNFGHSKHFKHILTNDDIRRMTVVEGRYPISRLPVCAGCEQVAYWGHGGQGVCPDCGTITKNPITLSEYMVKGYDIDKTGYGRDTAPEMQVRDVLLPEYKM